MPFLHQQMSLPSSYHLRYLGVFVQRLWHKADNALLRSLDLQIPPGFQKLDAVLNLDPFQDDGGLYYTDFWNQKTQVFFTVQPVVRSSKGGFDAGCYFYRFQYHSLMHLDLLVCLYVSNGSQNTFEHVNYCNNCKTWQDI